jgi:hypothetical protein
MAYLVEKRGSYLCNGAIKVLGAKVDFPVLFTAGVPDFMDTALAVCAASAVR